MATTPPPAISGLPAAPDPNNRSTFNALAYPWSAALPTLGTEISAVAANVKANADDAFDSASAALAISNVVLWVSGSTYATGAGVFSPINGQTYRRLASTPGSSTTDPSGDVVRWVRIQSGAYNVRTAIAASAIDLRAGDIFTKTITGATTFTVTNTPSAGNVGTFLLDLTNGGSAVVTWWADVKWAGGAAPTLTASGRDLLGFVTHDAGVTWSGLMLGRGMA